MPGRLWERFDQFLDAVEWGRTRLARLFTPAIGRDLFGGYQHFLGQAQPERAFHRADVGHPEGVEPSLPDAFILKELPSGVNFGMKLVESASLSW